MLTCSQPFGVKSINISGIIELNLLEYRHIRWLKEFQSRLSLELTTVLYL